MICTPTWTDLENITVSERSQSQKSHIVKFHSQKMSRIGKSTRMERRLVFAQGGGQEVGWGPGER